MLAHALGHRDLHAFDAVGGLLRVGFLLLREQRPLLALLLDRLEIAGRRFARQLLRNEVIPRVAVLHGDDVAAGAEAAHLLNENDFHLMNPFD